MTITGSVAGTLPAPNMTGPPNLFRYHPFEFVRNAWDPVPGADHYLLEYDNEPTFSLPLFNADFSPIPASETTAPIMFGEPVGNLWFRVRAVAADGTRSLPSNVRKVTITFNAPIPPAPLLVGTAERHVVAAADHCSTGPTTRTSRRYELQIGKDPTFAQANAAECTGVEWCVRGIPESQWTVPTLGDGQDLLAGALRARRQLADRAGAVGSGRPCGRSTCCTTPPGIQAFSIDVMTGNGLTVRSHTNAPSGTTPDNQVFGRLTLDNRIPPEGTVVSLTQQQPVGRLGARLDHRSRPSGRAGCDRGPGVVPDRAQAGDDVDSP